MRWIGSLLFSAAATAGCGLLTAQVAAPKPAPVPASASNPASASSSASVSASPQAHLLPDGFAGWSASEAPKIFTDAVLADAPNAAALKEYGFIGGEQASYKRSGDTLTLSALRFADATGSFGAYSFYRQSGWPKEEIGAGAASDHNRVLFWLGTTVIDANFSHMGPMSGGELRELATHLPLPAGVKSIVPPVLANLPRASLDGQTSHYALGPASYAGSGGVLPPDLVGFDLGAEAVTANYSLRSGPATLTVIDYPTPQMAIVAEGKIRNYIAAQQPTTISNTMPSSSFPVFDISDSIGCGIVIRSAS